jgi:glucosamine kinase
LGRAILSRSLQASDGLFPASALTRALIDEFGGPLAILAFAQQAEPREFARLAQGVVGAAKVGDRHGRAVMEDGAVWIAKSLRALGWTEGAPICLPGDLGAAYGLFLPEEMRAFVVRPQGSALDGALALARGLE